MDVFEIIFLVGIFIFTAASALTPAIVLIYLDTHFVLKYFRVIIDITSNPSTSSWKKRELKKFLLPSWERVLRITAQIFIVPLLVATLFVYSLSDLKDATFPVILGWLTHLVLSIILTQQSNSIIHNGGGIRATEIHISEDTYDVTYNEQTSTIHVSPQIKTDRSLMNYLYFFTGMISNTLCPIALYLGKKKALKQSKNE